MRLGFGCALMVMLGLISCGGNGGSTSVTGTDTASIKTAPAGVSTLAFMDVELVRPDHLNGAALPAGVTASAGLPASATLTFTNCHAANGGFINGTITVVDNPAGTFTETFDLIVTPTPAPVAGTPAQTIVYAGTQVVTLTGATAATLAIAPGALSATFTDNTVTPPAVKVYEISTPTPLTLAWTAPATTATLSGSYRVARLATAQSITVTLNPPLTWTSGCAFPNGGTLAIDLVSPGITDHTTVIFSTPCGSASIGGISLTLGQ